MVHFLIKRPIAVLMTLLAILIMGLLAIKFIPISLMPDIDVPEITIQISAENRSAREIEEGVVSKMRAELLMLTHLEEIESETSSGLAVIKLKFTHGTNIQYSFIEVNEKIDKTLPEGIDRPRVIKSSVTDLPIYYLNINQKLNARVQEVDHQQQEVTNFMRFTDELVKKRIEQIPEVALVDISGLVKSEILVLPHMNKLIALGISLDEIQNAITSRNKEIGNITVKDNQYQYSLRTNTKIKSVDEIQSIYINKDGILYQLKDLADIKLHTASRNGLVIFNGQESVSMAIIKKSDARIGDLKANIDNTIAAIEQEYPSVNFSITRDQTRLLKYAINNLTQSLIWGIFLAFLIMFLFLKDIRSALLIGISVPVSLVISLLFFQIFHISINIISLAGLILGMGLMIDNSIIVIDNITQYMEEGVSLEASCIKGANEISRPLFSSALTTCAVFIPLIFISGITGELFYDQAMAITIGLFVSLIVSILVLPVLYRLFHLKRRPRKNVNLFLKKLNFIKYEELYEKGFRGVMRNQKKTFGGFVFISLLAVLLFMVLPKSQMPELASSETLLNIDWNSPINAEENKKRTLDIIKNLNQPISTYNAFIGQQQFLLKKSVDAKPSQVTIYLKTNTPKGMVALKKEIANYIVLNYPSASSEYDDVDNIFSLIFAQDEPSLTIRLKDLENFQQKNLLNQMVEKVKKVVPEGTNITAIPWEEQILLVLNREKMMLYNITEKTLTSSLETAFGSSKILSIVSNQRLIPVLIGNRGQSVDEVLNKTLIQGKENSYFSLSEFVTRKKSWDLNVINAGKDGIYYPIHLNIDNSMEREITNSIKSVVASNPRFDVSFSGAIFKDRKLMKELGLILSITIILLYFILASQFESLWLPLIILLEIPLAIAGALLFLFLFDMSINLMSMIGIVVMSGIVINDSILKIDTVIQLQREGTNILKALLIAGQRRLKPILMTSLTTILALIPILFSNGLGSELQTPLVVALIGGMLIGTAVSLYFIPLTYYYLVKYKKKNVQY